MSMMNLQKPEDNLLKLTQPEPLPLNFLNLQDAKKMNIYMFLFITLLSAMNVKQGTVVNESKMLTLNASIQGKLNKDVANVTFAILPTGAKTVTIDQVQEENEDRSALRADISNNLLTERQNAQVMMTQASTDVSLLQQDASEDEGWISNLNKIYQVIIKMNPGAN